MRNESKFERKMRLFQRLADLGFTTEESHQLRRIQMTLHRWGELECGNGNDYASWAIERDEETGKPFMVMHPHQGKSRRSPVADREKGALKRLGAVVKARNLRATTDNDAGNFVIPYHQTDPRGCALYLVTQKQLGTDSIASVYTRGLAVCE